MENYLKEHSGLSSQDVKVRQEAGQQNNYEENVAKTNGEIFKDNIWTLFNLLNLVIGICLAAVGAFSNMAYLAIIAVNIMIGIYQEIHARNMVAKLSIISKEQAVVIRDSQEIKIDATDLVMDDTVILVAGEQVQSDMEVIAGRAEVNESLLTGESDLIVKEKDDQLLSGSFLSSGQCLAKVIHVGKDNYATKIANEAKVHKPIQSELVTSIRKVSKFTSYVIVPLGLILLVEALFIRQSDPKVAVVASAAALLGMLPKGLVLLISIALATAVTKLAKKRILVQDMYSVETLAHVDMLCLDKTGTITEGKMKVQHTTILDQTDQDEFDKIIGSYLKASTDNNITMQAIRDAYELNDSYQADDIFPFSSERKWGGINFKGIGAVALGAPERLVGEEQLPEQVERAQEHGYRVLMLAISPNGHINDNELPEMVPLAVFEIDDPIRQNADKTLAYLKSEGVNIKVISGDNPITVSNIARRAGLEGYESYVDLSEFQTEESVREAVNQYTVFGRVSPQQKQLLVNELQAQDHVVAMTGDGVNDVLALREADCSIAMAEGDSATRQIANLVLLDSDFTSLPDVLFEGRRVVNNVTKVASVFFIKTIYSFFLSILCAVTTLAFPFVPIQITLIDLAIEGYPAFFLSFEGDKRKVRTKFLPTVLRNALPNAILVLMNIIAVYIFSGQVGLSEIETTTLMYYLLIGVSLLAVIKTCLPLNPLRLFLIITTTIGIYVAAMLFHSILFIGFLTANTLPFFVLMMLITIALRLIISYFRKKSDERRYA
ncbi:cation-translocating P-type ATPase [Vagococcus intermedius]|uniref:HAD-IC family P-type ATPase n=1 Tax=Vagococcus intermedius TaxID=2991418 RepID=A0AAF0CTC8_9ENTE|nr:cation-translocating P-type ATPase [Vagococcus intermedius]WEG72639.1 HAD-IC family P-type ATPase [Vagococcus intermedius]WEG74725.1 HAD-IC family P-type ATPase [Vagococcus intermedius]